MSAGANKPVLLVGGTGAVGARAARALRRLQPELPIAIGARDQTRAAELADEIGGASPVTIDLDREDLGLPPALSVSGVAVLLKDQSLRSLKFAQARGVPYVSFSDWVFDIGPEVALHIHRPARAPILLLGHVLGGTVSVAAVHFAREFRRVRSIEVGAVVDEDDVGGPAAAVDMDRLSSAVPRSLVRERGRWRWLAADEATRAFRAADGSIRQGRALPVLDVVSLAAATDASSVRVDLAVRPLASRPAESGPSVEVVIDIEGERHDGAMGRARHQIVDDDVHSRLSAIGLALAVERVLGLAGGAPVAPGLYHPEGLLDPDYVLGRLVDFGARVQRV
jgi:hypothetical protein